MTTQRQLLDRLLQHYGLESYGSIRDDESQLLGLFADMRATPERLRELIEGVPDADDIVERFLFLVEASGDGIDRENDTVQPYAVVDDPPSADNAQVEALVRAHYAKLASLLREAGRDEAAEELEAERPFERCAEAPEVQDDYQSELGDFIRDHLDYDSLVRVLREAAYGFAASYELAWFMLWSHFAGSVATDDPFRPYATAWKLGLRVGRTADRLVAWTP